MIVRILTLLTGVTVAVYAVLWNNPVPMAAFIVFGLVLWLYLILNLDTNKKGGN